MDGLYKFYTDSEGEQFGFNPAIDHVSTSEVTFSEEKQSYKAQTRIIHQAEVETWLAKTLPDSSKDDQRKPSLRMVWVEVEPSTHRSLKVNQENFNAVLKAFQVEMAYNYSRTAATGYADFPSSSGNDTTHTYVIFEFPLLGLAWSHDPATRRISGVCWGNMLNITSIQKLIGYQKELCGDPMVLALFGATSLADMVQKNLSFHGHAISSIETRTGYHVYSPVSPAALDHDFSALSARASGSASCLANIKRTTRLINEALRFKSQISEQQSDLSGKIPDPDLQAMRKAMDKCEEMLRRRLVMQDAELEFLLQRTQVQLTALFNLVAQKDASLNIALAKDSRTLATASKRDSSSMKTLAAVTVAFLPATFVASFFAMPLFNWDAENNSSVVKGRFWIYWVVTAPLTLTVLAIWLTWTHRQTLLHRAQDRKDRDQIEFDIKGLDRIENDSENSSYLSLESVSEAGCSKLPTSVGKLIHRMRRKDGKKAATEKLGLQFQLPPSAPDQSFNIGEVK